MTSKRFLLAAVAAIAGTAFVEQLRLAPPERTWHGRIAGVPYDFRKPTAERSLAKLWNPDNPSICAPTLWGVGWTVNLYRLAHPLQS